MKPQERVEAAWSELAATLRGMGHDAQLEDGAYRRLKVNGEAAPVEIKASYRGFRAPVDPSVVKVGIALTRWRHYRRFPESKRGFDYQKIAQAILDDLEEQRRSDEQAARIRKAEREIEAQAAELYARAGRPDGIKVKGQRSGLFTIELRGLSHDEAAAVLWALVATQLFEAIPVGLSDQLLERDS
jgi:hypothetical protein